MSWVCNKCGSVTINACAYCVYCKYKHNVTEPRPVSHDYLYDDYEELLFKCRVKPLDTIILAWFIRIDKIVANKGLMMAMTPQEELFAEFFRDEKLTVKDMSVLELRQHREELAKIAFEARARLTAVDDEERDRKGKDKQKSKGFSASVQTDELTSNAINAITKQSVKLNKRESMIKKLMDKVGVDRATAEAMVPDVEKTSAGKAINSKSKLESINSGATVKTEQQERASQPFTNPFGPKPEVTQSTVEVSIVEETNSVVVTKTEEPVKQVSFNPFAK